MGYSIGFDMIPFLYIPWYIHLINFLILTGIIICGIHFFNVRKRLKIRLNQEHLQIEKMKSLDKMKSEFFANVSHEFRTPLTLILGPLNQLLQSEYDISTRRKLLMAARNSRKLLFRVNQLLDFAKLNYGQLSLRAQEAELIEFVKLRFASFESLALSRGINYQFKSNTKKLLTYFDKDKLEKILVNLISNAFKFTLEGKSIIVEVNKNSKQSHMDKGHGVVEIIVKDKGIGINTEHLFKIFERYYQVPNRNSQYQLGSGIGLTLVKELVELHHGTITVKSKEGKGSTFKIVFPIGKDHLSTSELLLQGESERELFYDRTYSRPAIDDQAKRQLFEANEFKHVLIIEDNEDMRAYIREILMDNYIIDEASNGRQGLERSITNIPDLIISDILMPEMDGIEFCKKLREDERISHIPVIMLTAKAGKSDRLEGYKMGVDDYIVKPFSANELQARVNNLIDQRRNLRERFRKDITLLPKEIAITSADERFLERALNVLEKLSGEDKFGPVEFSYEIGLSRSQLHRKLKALTDQSVGEFIRSYRLNRAHQLLKFQFGNVAQVCFECGFSNPSYFAECFKAKFKISPSQFARQVSEGVNAQPQL